MNAKPKIAIIGAGMMGEAIIVGLLRNKVVGNDCILVSEPRQERREELSSRYDICCFADNKAVAGEADVVILAVKPQTLNKVLASMDNLVPPEALVLSIVAGASIQSIAEGLGHPAIVRSMPNTPAQVGQGITVWTTSDSVSAEQKEFAQTILAAFGEEIFVEEENYLDMATALSGSGPAYVFLFMEAMIDAGVHLGFPRWISEKLVTQTLRGSVEYYSAKKEHPARLKNEVTSPGGTSAAALYYLEKAGVRTAISRAIWAAYERSMQLGKGKSAEPPDKNWNNE